LLTDEIKYQKELYHKNIVEIVDYGTNIDFICEKKSNKKVNFIVTKLCGNGELFGFLLYTGKFDERLA